MPGIEGVCAKRRAVKDLGLGVLTCYVHEDHEVVLE